MVPPANSSHPNSTRDDANEDLAPGTNVGEYVITRKIGSGAFGDVYAGEHPVIGKKVAIKVLRRHIAADQEMVSRLVAEARAVNRIRQVNIVDIFGFGELEEQQRHYIVMELLEGQTLGQLLAKSGRIPLAAVITILQGIAGALDAVHEAGITHRDLKPDNVFLTTNRDGTYFPKLLDFGIAKLLGDDVAHRTSAGAVMGTPRYMSPEQARGKAADPRSDIYALGVMTHEMLTGTPPFAGDSGVDVLVQHVSETPSPMSTICPDVPVELNAPVLAMLAKRPGDRPATAGEAIAAIVEAARRVEGETRRVEPNDALVSSSRPGFQALTHPELAPSGGSNSGAPRERLKIRAENSQASHDAPIPKRTWILAAIAIFCVGSFFLFRGIQSSAKSPEVATTVPSAVVVEAAPTPSIAPSKLPETISLRLETQPAEVEVWIEDRKLGNSSAPIILPRATNPIVLQLRKTGFKDLRIELVPDRDQTRAEILSPLMTKTRPTSDSTKQDHLEKVLGGRD